MLGVFFIDEEVCSTVLVLPTYRQNYLKVNYC